MPQKDLVLRSLNRQDLVRKMKVLLEELDYAYQQVDDVVLEQEAQVGSRRQFIVEYEERITHLKAETEQISTEMKERLEQRDLLDDQRNMLMDYKGFVEGGLFHGSARGAVFFTLSLKDFSYQNKLGEMTVEQVVERSEDGFSAVLDGQSYAYLKASDGQVYFHPQSIDGKVFLGVASVIHPDEKKDDL
ncbi:MAG: hypothetical protein Q8O95_04975 [bacterium]|nr:hypothetical protein [bacterium]